ncbi:transglutaminase family protein [Geoalkalibacter halelectricus]|uniref:Transglutaminase family protein n=1 Tax=Geoalkalibacter halelectricus TaxID=2847045 RepID=A0ABY5ZSS7_9BACT|nr:transglutaminase family protein [Geoalkalibacter halelectricus]MDO3379249.1 transglutaminase family protein [Geoalkalibacter halelectricus]UWZ81007.1 transglutaminase family protein [Geoalkalibacter halelectricus]
MNYRVTHTTEFVYEAKVGLCYNEARLLPRELPYQKLLSSGLHIDPPPNDYYERFDYFGNRTVYFSTQQPHERLEVTATSEVEVSPSTLLEQNSALSWEAARDQLRQGHSAQILEACQFILDSPSVGVDEQLAEYARPSFAPGRGLVEGVHDLMQRIFREFKYDPEFSTLATPLKEVLEHRSGVCQDFAHLAIGCLRSQGLAARYVSGYIETQPPPGKERLVGADASHAWFSVFVPDLGWLDFDPTNNQLPGEQHITLAWGRDFSDVTPLKGVAYGGGKHELKVAVDVLRRNGNGR